MEAYWTYGEKAWQQLHKNAASNTEQVLEATPTKQQLYGHIPSITKTIKFKWTRHAGHNWRSRDEVIRDILLWTTSYGQRLDDQRETIYNSSLPIQNVAWMTCRDQWTIGMMVGKKEGQGDPCWQRDLIMMMGMIVNPFKFYQFEPAHWPRE